jgi:hypothetical protein
MDARREEEIQTMSRKLRRCPTETPEEHDCSVRLPRSCRLLGRLPPAVSLEHQRAQHGSLRSATQMAGFLAWQRGPSRQVLLCSSAEPMIPLCLLGRSTVLKLRRGHVTPRWLVALHLARIIPIPNPWPNSHFPLPPTKRHRHHGKRKIAPTRQHLSATPRFCAEIELGFGVIRTEAP